VREFVVTIRVRASSSEVADRRARLLVKGRKWARFDWIESVEDTEAAARRLTQ